MRLLKPTQKREQIPQIIRKKKPTSVGVLRQNMVRFKIKRFRSLVLDQKQSKKNKNILWV